MQRIALKLSGLSLPFNLGFQLQAFGPEKNHGSGPVPSVHADVLGL